MSTRTALADASETALDPVYRSSEVIFGLLMAMSFIGSISVATDGQEEVRTLLVAALGCNLAWGLVDAVMLLVAVKTEKRRNRALLQTLHGAADHAAARAAVAGELPGAMARSLGEDGLELLRQRLTAAPPTPSTRLRGRDYGDAFVVFLLVVLSTFPLCWLLDRLNALHRRRRAVRRRALIEQGSDSWWRTLRLLSLQSPPAWFTGAVYVVLIVIYGWAFVSRYADYRADLVRRGEAAQVRVWLNGDASGLSASDGAAWTYLGAVSNYVFVFDPATRRAVALPVNNIARIEPVAGTPDPGKTTAIAPIR